MRFLRSIRLSDSPELVNASVSSVCLPRQARPVAVDDTVSSVLKVPLSEVGSNSNTPGFIVLS